LTARTAQHLDRDVHAGDRFVAHGRYDETYEKRDGKWYIKETLLTTRWVEETGRRMSADGLMSSGPSQ
jgi:hypothetical protein